MEQWPLTGEKSKLHGVAQHQEGGPSSSGLWCLIESCTHTAQGGGRRAFPKDFWFV